MRLSSGCNTGALWLVIFILFFATGVAMGVLESGRELCYAAGELGE